MKINLPVNLLHPALLAAALLSAGAGLVFGYANYNDCRCNQGAPYASDSDNIANCCSVTTSSWYSSNSSKCKTPCTAVSCSYGKNGNTYLQDAGGCCNPCGWVQGTRLLNTTEYCVSQSGTASNCYVENSVTYSLANMNLPQNACTAAKKGQVWKIPGAGSGVCVPSMSPCPGMIIGYEDVYTCTCS